MRHFHHRHRRLLVVSLCLPLSALYLSSVSPLYLFSLHLFHVYPSPPLVHLLASHFLLLLCSLLALFFTLSAFFAFLSFSFPAFVVTSCGFSLSLSAPLTFSRSSFSLSTFLTSSFPFSLSAFLAFFCFLCPCCVFSFLLDYFLNMFFLLLICFL